MIVRPPEGAPDTSPVHQVYFALTTFGCAGSFNPVVELPARFTGVFAGFPRRFPPPWSSRSIATMASFMFLASTRSSASILIRFNEVLLIVLIVRAAASRPSTRCSLGGKVSIPGPDGISR